MISGRQYFVEKGTEIMDITNEVGIFRVMWLRKDSVGNVLLGAINTSNGSTKIDSATVIGGVPWFPNGFLTKGYSLVFPQGKESMQDSVVSVSATVSVSAGTFTQCLEISETNFDSTGKPYFHEEHYYARGIGLVKNVRTLPIADAHTDELIGYGTTGVIGGVVDARPNEFLLSQNFPDPFNPSTTIRYSLPATSRVSLRIYNILGQQVANLVNSEQSAGWYETVWNANVASGLYFYRIDAVSTADPNQRFTQLKKMMLLK